nr:Rpn family recombination-promoting nuclease/putative transposase [Membranihabitans maritimus]
MKAFLRDIEMARDYFAEFLPNSFKTIVDLYGIRHACTSFISGVKEGEIFLDVMGSLSRASAYVMARIVPRDHFVGEPKLPGTGLSNLECLPTLAVEGDVPSSSVHLAPLVFTDDSGKDDIQESVALRPPGISLRSFDRKTPLIPAFTGPSWTQQTQVISSS